MSSSPLSGKVCLVTGGTRGIGKGIAIQLAEAGATVYFTGRTMNAEGATVSGSLTDTAKEITARGGRCVPVQCDHTKDEDIESLFEKIRREQQGQLDVLVNNAYAGVTAIAENIGKPFWEQPLSMWDLLNNVGLRNHYMCAVHASRMMVPRNQGLIVNISSAGGLTYVFNVAYGIGKEGCDRMAADCGLELKKHNVAFVSLWPGGVMTEHVVNMLDGKTASLTDKSKHYLFEDGETAEYVGKCIVYLALDPKIMHKTGKIAITRDLADEYGIVEENGRIPLCLRQLNMMPGVRRFKNWIPDWIKIPKWLVSFAGHKL